MVLNVISYQKLVLNIAHRLFDADENNKPLHGHTWVVEVYFRGEPTEDGLLVDNKGIERYFENNWNNRVLLNASDPLGATLAYAGLPFVPMVGNPTPENIARRIQQDLRAQRVLVRETAETVVEYPG
jgi:6-pyruvoyl-tetrahydropterin synthase